MEEIASKRCSRCKEEKPLSAFGPKRGTKLQPYCRACQSAYSREHYHANKEAWRQKRARWEAKIRALKLAARDRPCADCGGRWHPMVMEFDHLPGTEKLSELGHMRARKWGWRKILAEIAKCDVVCLTCHRLRTFRRRGRID